MQTCIAPYLQYQNLQDALKAAAFSHQKMYWHLADGLCIQTYQALQEQAWLMAKKIAVLDLKGRVGLIAHMTPEFVTLFLACQYVGLTPVVLPTPRFNRNAWQVQTSKMLGSANAKSILVMTYQEAIEPIEGIDFIIVNDIAGECDAVPMLMNTEAYIQFSSGSTSDPKGIVITQAALLHNIKNILQHGLQIQANDKAISWLPFYHDMGLVGFLLAPLVCQCEIHFLPSQQFLRQPVKWLALISEYQLSISYAPNFAYQRLASMPITHAHLDLTSWRIAGIGAEKIHPQTLCEFYRAFKQYGFKQEAFWPSYGMAESTLAISMNCPQHSNTKNSKDKNTAMASGRVLPDTDIRIVRDGVADMAGEIWVKSPSMATHYANGDLIAKDNGYFATGDVGYIEDGNLVVVGRKKESILIHGQNIWPQDVESILNNELPEGILVLVFGLEQGQTEQLCVLFAKNHWQPEQIVAVKNICRTCVFTSLSIVVNDDNMLFSTNKTILKTSSGKLARLAVKEMYHQQQLMLIDPSKVGEAVYAAT